MGVLLGEQLAALIRRLGLVGNPALSLSYSGLAG